MRHMDKVQRCWELVTLRGSSVRWEFCGMLVSMKKKKKKVKV